MANNVPITAGAGTTVATDQLVGGEHVQLIKLVAGAEDASARIDGDVTNGLDVDVTRTLGSSTLYVGTQSATSTAAALTTQEATEVLLQNDVGGATDVFVGNATTQPWRLQPGENIAIPVTNANLIYVRTASGSSTVNWIGRN